MCLKARNTCHLGWASQSVVSVASELLTSSGCTRAASFAHKPVCESTAVVQRNRLSHVLLSHQESLLLRNSVYRQIILKQNRGILFRMPISHHRNRYKCFILQLPMYKNCRGLCLFCYLCNRLVRVIFSSMFSCPFAGGFCWGLSAGYQPRPQVVDRGTTARYGGQLRYI